MTANTTIEWTDATWNPVTGCSKVSQGCKFCYAERLFPRPYPGRAFTDVRTHADRLLQPIQWARGRRIFVNSMSDLFHQDVPFQFIADVFAVMACTTRHTYQILTKRPERMLEWFRWLRWDGEPYDARAYHECRMTPDQVKSYRVFAEWRPQRPGRGGYDNCGPSWPLENVWLGVSAEDQKTADERIPLLMQVPAVIHFLSGEPLLGPIDLNATPPPAGTVPFHPFTLDDCRGCLPRWQTHPMPAKLRDGLDWVIVGGESGPKARAMFPSWARSIRDQCVAASVPFFFKQWGEHAPCDPTAARTAMVKVGKKVAGRELDGRTWDNFPELAR
jgi:protein gp37